VDERSFVERPKLSTIPSLPSITISEAFTHEEEIEIESEEQLHLLRANACEAGSRSSLGKPDKY